jgi:hypothetical protein
MPAAALAGGTVSIGSLVVRDAEPRIAMRRQANMRRALLPWW